MPEWDFRKEHQETELLRKNLMEEKEKILNDLMKEKRKIIISYVEHEKTEKDPLVPLRSLKRKGRGIIVETCFDEEKIDIAQKYIVLFGVIPGLEHKTNINIALDDIQRVTTNLNENILPEMGCGISDEYGEL